MSRYRILAKDLIECVVPRSELPKEIFIENKIPKRIYYICRYIVQERVSNSPLQNGVLYELPKIIDLKEFNNLEEARKFKKSLQLKDGIIIE